MKIGPNLIARLPPHSQIISVELADDGAYCSLLSMNTGVFDEQKKLHPEMCNPNTPLIYAVRDGIIGSCLEFLPPPDGEYEVRVTYAPPWQEA